MRVLRWVLVLPAGALGAAAAAFILHWFLFANCRREESFIQLDEVALESTERFLMAFAGPLGFLLAAAKTAPRFKLAATMMLGLLILVGGPLLVHRLRSSENLIVDYTLKQWVLQLVAVVVACLAAYVQGKKKGEQPISPPNTPSATY